MKTAIVFLLCFWTGLAGAAAPLQDQLIVDGKAEPLPVSPLQPALDSDPKLNDRLKRYLSKKPCPEAARGYVGTWEIRDNALYLVKLDVDPCGGGKSVPLSLIFSGASAPVKAEWFSGELKAASGSKVIYVKGGAVTGSATLERGKGKK